jgi:hypothetical protein
VDEEYESLGTDLGKIGGDEQRCVLWSYPNVCVLNAQRRRKEEEEK